MVVEDLTAITAPFTREDTSEVALDKDPRHRIEALAWRVDPERVGAALVTLRDLLRRTTATLKSLRGDAMVQTHGGGSCSESGKEVRFWRVLPSVAWKPRVMW